MMLRLWPLCLFLLILLIGCGGGGGGGGSSDGGDTGSSATAGTATASGDGGGTGGLTEGQKLAFLDSMGTQIDGWRGLSKDQLHSNLVSWAKAQTIIENAGISPETNTVWMTYTDGTGTFYLDNFSIPSAAASGRAPLTRGKDMPGQRDSYLIFSLEDYFADGTPWLVEKLNAHGYFAVPYQYPDIPTILNMQDAGIIYWAAHAGPSKHKDKTTGALNDISVLVTGEKATQTLSSGAYQAYISAGEVQTGSVDFRDPSGNLRTVKVYAITDRFIEKYLRLSPSSLVAIDACQSGNALMARAWKAAQAGTFIGWDLNSGNGSVDVMTTLFDRLLGTNEMEPKSPAPPERPFNMETVKRWMQENALDHDSSSSAQLKFFDNSPSTLTLRPTISRILLEGKNALSSKTKLLIEGTFGPKPAGNDYEVTWGGTKLNILDWNEIEGIRVSIPNPPPVGEVQVRRDTRLSNKVPMTEWVLPVKYTMIGQGTLKYVIDFKLRFRGDVHLARYFPQDVPSGVPTPFWHLSDSTATVTASGQYKPDANTTITWSNGVPSKSYDQEEHANSIVFFGSIDIGGRKIKDFFLSNDSTYTVKRNGVVVSTPPAAVEGYFQFNMLLNTSTYGVPAGTVAPTLSITSPYCVSASLSYGPIAATAGTAPSLFGTPR